MWQTDPDTLVRIAVMLVELSLALSLLVWIRAWTGPRQGQWAFFLKLLCYGGLVAVICAYVEIRYAVDVARLQESDPVLAGRFGADVRLLNVFTASAVEELAKYAAAAFALLNSRRVQKLSDAIVYLIVIGLGFSLVEDLLFMLNPDTVAPYRLFSFYVHSGTSAVVGYSLGRFMSGIGKYRELLLAIAGAIALHFSYNLSTGIGGAYGFTLTICISLYISLQVFLLFKRAVLEEYRLGHRFKTGTAQRLLNLDGGKA